MVVFWWFARCFRVVMCSFLGLAWSWVFLWGWYNTGLLGLIGVVAFWWCVWVNALVVVGAYARCWWVGGLIF